MKEKLFKIRKANGDIEVLSLEIPVSAEDFNNGLAFRDEIPQNTGMIYDFVYDDDKEARMYTPDTKIPVDFIFIDDTGFILHIHHMAEPLSDKIINCFSTSYVIELAGGEAKRLGIEEGDILLFDNIDSDLVYTTPDYIDGVFYKNTGSYFCKMKNGVYQYSYRTHSWVGPIDEDIEWRFFEREQALKRINCFGLLPKEHAIEACIKRDLELTNNYKKYKKFYYQLNETLFVSYEPKTGILMYYSYLGDWINLNIGYSERVTGLDFLRWYSVPYLKEEVDGLIDIEKGEFEEYELKNIDAENAKYITKILSKMYPLCNVFYKEDSSEGWRLAEIAGTKPFVEEQCKRFQAEKNWSSFVVFNENRYAYCQKNDWSPCVDFNIIHNTSDWLYDIDTNKWYISPDEQLPLPITKAKKVKALSFNVNFGELEEYDFDEDENRPVTLDIDLEVNAGKESASFNIDYIIEKEKLESFIQEVNDDKKYIQLSLDEYQYIKAFIWQKDDKIDRFQIQDWNSNDLNILLDVEIDKNTLKEAFCNLAVEIERKEKECIDNYKKQFRS